MHFGFVLELSDIDLIDTYLDVLKFLKGVTGNLGTK